MTTVTRRCLSGVLSLALLGLGGCFANQKQNFANISAPLDYAGRGAVAVAVRDQRPYVLDDDKPPTFTGLQLGTYGIPFKVNTASGQPLAQDMTDSISDTLDAAGFDAVPVPLPIMEDGSDARARLLVTHARRIVLLVLNDWTCETYKNATLHYDVTLHVFDDKGNALANKQMKGSDELGGNFFNPAGHAETAVEAAFRKKLSLLLDSPEIAKALR